MNIFKKLIFKALGLYELKTALESNRFYLEKKIKSLELELEFYKRQDALNLDDLKQNLRELQKGLTQVENKLIIQTGRITNEAEKTADLQQEVALHTGEIADLMADATENLKQFYEFKNNMQEVTKDVKLALESIEASLVKQAPKRRASRPSASSKQA